MNILNKFKKTIGLLFCGIYLFSFSYCGAQSLSTKVDGNNEMVSVWHKADPKTGLLTIVGSYGTLSPKTVTITNPLLVHAYNPVLATSRNVLSATQAVAVWRSYVLLSESFAIQTSLVFSNGSGWTPGDVTTFEDSNELPAEDYKVDISGDGTVITILWSTHLAVPEIYKLRLETSTDSGASWKTTYLDVL